jgi:putative flippase GtrA
MEKQISEITRKENITHIIKFTLFSASAGLIQIVSFSLLNELLVWKWWPSYLIALTLSVLWNFTLNRKYTFKSAANIPVAMTKVAVYYGIFTPLSLWWGDALTEVAGWNYYVVLIGTMLINFITEFLFTRFIVYRNQINTALTDEKLKK